MDRDRGLVLREGFSPLFCLGGQWQAMSVHAGVIENNS